MPSSRFWGVNWDRRDKKWRARYRDAGGKFRHIGYFDDEEDAARAVNKAIRDAGLEGQRPRAKPARAAWRRMNRVAKPAAKAKKPAAMRRYLAKKAALPDPGAPSKHSGVCWDKTNKKWKAYYKDADGKQHSIGLYDDEDEAARVYNKAIRDAGLEGRRRMNVDATGAALVPKPSDGPKEQTSKFWGVHWNKNAGKWEAGYQDAHGLKCYLGLFDDQESAALAVNAAIRTLPAAVQRRRRANPVVDGKLVPKKRAPRKRRREEDTGVPCAICFDPTTVTLVCGHAMCEECMGRLAVFQGQTLTRSRRRVVIQCPLRCHASTERVLA